MHKLRIAMIGQKGFGLAPGGGGIERHVEELSRGLCDLGYKVTVYGRPWYQGKLKVKSEKLKVVVLPCIHSKHLDAISHTFLATLHATRGRFDIIHYHGVGPALLAFLPRIFAPRSRVVITFHCIDRRHQKWGVFARSVLKAGEWAACHFAHKTIAVSKTLCRYCGEVYGKRTVYIPNGIRAPKSHCGSKRTIKKFGLEPNKYILMVSRLVPHKGAHTLIEAYNALQEAHFKKQLPKLAIVGGGAFTQDYVGRLRKMADLNPCVVFTGHQGSPALDNLYKGARLVVHPSESEGLPISVLEAQSFGKPVLVSDIPENLEAVGKNGFRFKAGSVCDLNQKLKKLIPNLPLLKSKGQDAKGAVLKKYNWDLIVKKIEQLYQSLV